MDLQFGSAIVSKPWGSEYMAYSNEDVALWVLHIREGESTSMHCHSEKTTGLVCFEGSVTVNFLADQRDMNAVSKVMIRRGLFHQTTSTSKGGSIVFEIESPNKKTDLLRLNDKYGRKSKSYEGKEFYSSKDEKCLQIKNPNKGASKSYLFRGKTLLVEHVVDIDVINSKKDDDLVFLLSGGIYRKIDGEHFVATRGGDVGYAKIMKQVSTQMDGLMPNTIILTIPNE